MAKQKDGRYRAKITVGTDASGESMNEFINRAINAAMQREEN